VALEPWALYCNEYNGWCGDKPFHNAVSPGDTYDSAPASCIVGGVGGPPLGGVPAGLAAAVGDPHLKNVNGERFDLMKPGQHVLINVPRGASVDDALLRVQADARRLGSRCADLYFQEINITGTWTGKSQTGGYHFLSYRTDEGSDWMAFGKVQIKVVHAHTLSGVQYLNFYVKHLGQAGFPVGGLLGEDDHVDAATPRGACVNHIVLASDVDVNNVAISYADASV